MQRESIYKHYEPAVQSPNEKTDSDFWFIFYKGTLLIKNHPDDVPVPQASELNFLSELSTSSQFYEESHYLGTFKGQHCYCFDASTDVVPEGMSFMDLRTLYPVLEEDLFLLAGKATQILHWNRTHEYCGACGAKAVRLQDERAKKCPVCGLINYPRISPAIIVGIFKEDKILLARSKSFPGKRFSVIAGFLEPGETLEECVQREIMEEVGITVKNIKYFGNQPWPFPHSMMIGFTADYESREICVDDKEIAEADWFTVKDLPEIPTGISISRELIDYFIEKNS